MHDRESPLSVRLHLAGSGSLNRGSRANFRKRVCQYVSDGSHPQRMIGRLRIALVRSYTVATSEARKEQSQTLKYLKVQVCVVRQEQ